MHKALDDLVTLLERGALARRQLMQSVVAVLAHAAVATNARASVPPAEPTVHGWTTNVVEESTEMKKNKNVAYGETTLPAGIRSRFVNNINGLTMHMLEAGFEVRDRPCVLLLHGFPELAYCWRKVMLPLAQAGFHVVAPDQRGYGRTTGWDGNYDGDVGSFRLLNLVRDTLGRGRLALRCSRQSARIGFV